MDEIILSRHAESVAAVEKLANGDPASDPGLTDRGREQAEELGRTLSGDEIHLCITSEFPRTRETAGIALAGRDLEWSIDSRLNDIHYGEFEGRPIDEYRAWAHEHALSMAPPGGESRVQVASRLCAALEELLALPPSRILIVTHEKLLADLLAAAGGRAPEQHHPDIDYATGYRFTVQEVRAGIELLRKWIADQEDVAASQHEAV